MPGAARLERLMSCSERPIAADHQAPTCHAQGYVRALWEKLAAKMFALRMTHSAQWSQKFSTVNEFDHEAVPLQDQIREALQLLGAIRDLEQAQVEEPQTTAQRGRIGRLFHRRSERSLARDGDHAWQPVSARTAARYEV